VAAERLTDRTRAQLFEEALALGATVGVLHDPSEFVAHEQTRLRGFFADTGFPGVGGAPFATVPWKLSATPAGVRRPAPSEDEHDPPSPAAPRKATPAAPSGQNGLLLE